MQLLIDGNNLLHRAFHALAAEDDGTHNHAVIGFVNMLLTCIRDYQPFGIHVAFDTWPIGTNKRLKIYDQYKANRDRDSDVYIQISKAKMMCERAGLSVYYQEGYEADDILCSLTGYLGDNDMVIVTNDGDLMQLATGKVGVTKIKGQFIDRQVFHQAEVLAHYSVKPSQILQVKALMGDKSDNVPGVPGIGEVWAKRLIQTYGTLEVMYKELDVYDDALEASFWAGRAVCRKLKSGKDMAYLSRQLCQLMKPDFSMQIGMYSTARIDETMRAMGIIR